jgi:hypothetical protein
MKQVRSVDFLPEIFQTPVNKQFLSATLDQLIQNPQYSQKQGFIGRRIGPGVNANDYYVVEPTKTRTDYQLEPSVVQIDPTDSHKVVDAITYPGINDALQLQGAITDNANRLYTSDYYTWDPFVDFDKFVNYAQYYWLPGGPLPVQVFSTTVPNEETFTVTRSNGAYTFSGYQEPNPNITLVRSSPGNPTSYQFEIAQPPVETVTFRVTNNNASSWDIDYEINPTLSLVRGNTYNFNLLQTAPWAFYIKTEYSLGTTNIYSDGVFNNGGSSGLVTFTVPYDAPDTLYYCNDIQLNLRGQLNISDPAPGNGPKFWIQGEPGINGRLPIAKNISSRDVLGVVNNGTDYGTVTFAVPEVTAQDQYYNMPSIGQVDLITDLAFDQIDGQLVSDFLAANPNGIDGITNLQSRTLAFISQDSSPTPTNLYSVWRIQYLTDHLSRVYLSLQFVQSVNLNHKFTIGFGSEYSSTSWYKNTHGYFSQIPLLTADKDVLYYQDSEDPTIFGKITFASALNVNDIIGSKTYTSPNGVTFSNGMKVQFVGDVTPAAYQNNEYYVEGVGSSIQLLPVYDFITPETYTKDQLIPYDTTPYDSGNYDGDLNQPLLPDYITINRASPDLNAWTRSNRWFHIDVINASAAYNNTVAVLDNRLRGRRPILEFRAGTRLFDFGTQGKQAVDIIDFSQTDAFSSVAGSTGFSTDGYTLINGSTIIFAADTDLNVRNTIYTVKFITPDTVPPLIAEPIIVLEPATDGVALVDQTTVILSGNTQQGHSYYWDGVNWIQAQQKNSVNQPPLFDIYDNNGISFGNQAVYQSSNFKGSPLFSYAIGDAAPDLVLGFPLTYLSLTNIGDIVFDNNFYKDTFNYTLKNVGQTVPLSQGFVRQYNNRITYQREIGWQPAVTTSLVRQQFQFVYDGTPLLLDVAVNENTTVPAVQIFINGQFQEAYNYSYTVSANTTTINLLTTYVPGDVVEVAVLSNQVSSQGFYQVPINLSNNPLNGNSDQLTLGTIRNHYSTIAQNLIALSGPVIGPNNTRDLGDIVPYGLQILQQSSPLTLAGYFMRDANYDIFASLAYNSNEYVSFKNQLLNAVTTFSIAEYGNWTVAQLLDASIAKITAGRTNINSFYWSDMLPTGTGFISNSYVVNPITTSRFNTVQTYDFTKSNYLGLCVYVDNVLLTREYDYVVSTDSPTLTITVPLTIGSTVTINEYSNTAGNFVPNTPTKLGLYPKYKPEIFYDTDYVNPTPVIQGHDGSITVAFGDIRDQVLLEFEQRIFSNLKNDGNPVPLVAEDVIPGYFRTTDYSQTEINQILGESFLTWVGANKLDYTQQTYIADNEFTYNYSQAGNKLDAAPLLGAWRGIYRYFYDTLTPNLTPWEMLGFSEMPTWWADRYGPTPYTSDNLVLWGDLEAGLVADPVAPYVIPKYRRPGLTQVIPVNSQGELLPPFYSVMGAYDPQGFVKSWQVGDGGPVEASWWMSSSYPFAVMRLLLLTRPAEFFSLFADRDLYKYSAEFDQYLYNGRYRLRPQDVQVVGNGVSKASYINWIIDYNQQYAVNSTDSLTTDLANLDVRLAYRMASFVPQQNLDLYLEKGAPQSQNDSLLVPPESYNLLFYKNQPFNRINYSAVIVEVVADGYSVYGYSTTDPYFTVLASKISGLTQTITAGTASVTVPSQYTNQIKQVPYGYTFTNKASVVDFLLSYGQYLTSQGLSFVVQENGYTMNWAQMAQEFLYFSNQGWTDGTLINLNPSANQVISLTPGAVVDSIITYTPENLLLNQNSGAFPVKDLIIYRQNNTFKLNPAPGGNQTISYLQLQYTDYEDIVILDNTTIFNDLIYDPITAERQNRLKLSASTSTQWDGTLNAQGFILNQNNVVAWKPNSKYTKGDIVIYKNNYWQAANIVQPKTQFDFADWYKSNYDRIQQGLLQNLATKADQLANSYNVQTANLNNDNDLLAYGLIGFKPRQYMVDLNLTDSSQVQLYQQFIKTMGSRRATDLLTQVNFNQESGQYNIYETWGVQVGTYGAQANRSWFEIALNEALLTGNPSTIQITQPGESSQADQTVLLNNLWAESYAIPNTNILPTTYTTNLDTALPSAGYVNINDVDITVFNLNDPTAIAAKLTTIGNGTRIWVAQDNSYNWNIYQCAQVPGRLIQISDNLNGTSRATFSDTVDLSVGDLIVVRYFSSAVDGVYRVLSRPTIDSVVIEYSFNNSNQTSLTGTGIAFYLQSMRVNQASDIVNLPYANQLVPGATAWVDNNGSGHWEVLQKTNPFTPIETVSADGLETDSLFGSSVAQCSNHTAMLVGAPGNAGAAGAVYTYVLNNYGQYVENTQLLLTATGTVGYGNSVDFGDRVWAVAGASGSNSGAGYATIIYSVPGTSTYLQTQLLVAPDSDFSAIGFGSAVKISQDERWIYIGAPGGNKVYSYSRVDVPFEIVNYVSNGTTSRFNYSNSITINPAYPGQLIVIINNALQTYGTDYILNAGNVEFSSTPTLNNKIIIQRRTSKQLDENVYPNVTQNSSTGSGAGAVFSVTNTRGVYLVNLTNPGHSYSNGEQLTISYTQVDPTGSSANNLVITVTQTVSGAITEFTIAGSGVSNTSTFDLENYLYTATSYDSFTVIVNNILQRPHIDYTFSGTTLTFLTVPSAGATIIVDSAVVGAYWQYVNTISDAGVDSNAQFGQSITTDQLGRQILIGAPRDGAKDANNTTITNAGAVYAFDRSTVRYEISNPLTLTYAIPGAYTAPVSVMLNNQYLTNTSQYINGQFTVSGGNIVLSSSVNLAVGDFLDIETNQFQPIQKFAANTVIDETKFGQSLDICSNNCSVYVGAPFDYYATGVVQAGMVQRQVNQSRIYGVTTSTVANPTLTPGQTIRINLQPITIPSAPNNTIAGLVNAINNSGIPNVAATASPDVILTGDGNTQIFDIGNIYSGASSYTTVVYVDNVLQTAGVDYTYNNVEQQISFLTAPATGAHILVVSGRLTVSVINVEAAAEFNKLSVLPGTTGTAFDDLGFTTYAYTQTIVSPNPTNYAQFGTSVSVNTGAVNLVVGSPNGDVYEPTTFDGGKTYFDEHSTTFFGYVTNSGVVYTYDYLPSSTLNLSNPGKFVFGQQVYVNGLAAGDRFGKAVDYRSGRLVVGAPVTDNVGSTFVLDNPTDAAVWNVVYYQLPTVDVSLLNSVYTYNKLLNSTQTYFDYIDPLQGKILGVARRNIDYIGAVDPANYNNGAVHNMGTSWGSERVGQIWWDTNSVRFIDANQDNLTYASRRWAQVFPGSRIDIYQWTASTVAPANYTGPGIPLSTVSYTTRSDISNQGIVTTTYYFWVRGIATTATQYGKTLSPTAIAQYILDPLSSGLPYIAGLSANAFAIYNASGLLSANDTIIHIEYDRQAAGGTNDIHTEYQFVADGKADSFLNPNLYRKLLDSFCGATTTGELVPDANLSPGMRYGVQFRPRQSMFLDRYKALENYLTHVNNILAQYPISEIRKFNLLNSAEPTPLPNSGAWDYEVPNLTILSYQDINTVPLGYLYLVLSDSSQQGRWTIYQVATSVNDSNIRVLNLVRVQSYDTPLYWSYINWYQPGYNSTIQPVTTVTNTAGLQTLSLTTAPIGSSVRVSDNGKGKFEIYLRTGIDPVNGWQRVGLEDGTIAFSNVLWNYPAGGFGFDAEVFDATYFDQDPVVETRQILKAINEELFTDDLLIYRNESLILMFKFIYSEFESLTWLIKTSYIDVEHVVRGLYPYELYQPDNQTFVLNYLTEVKPYHVQTSSFNLIYDGLDTYPGAMTDYDVPAYWDTTLEIPQFVSPILLPYNYAGSVVQSDASDAPANSQIWLERPWSDWFNAYTLSVESVTIIDGGYGYATIPTVTVEGACTTPAKLTATIDSGGHILFVTVIDPGAGYTTTPTIVFTSDTGVEARAVPNMGNNLVRSIKTTIKYDRCEYTSTVVEWQANVVYNQNELVRYDNRVWSANTTHSSATFVMSEWTLATAPISATNIVAGKTYTIHSLSTSGQRATNFIAIGASRNEVGVTFVATGPGTNSGTVILLLNGADRTMGYYTPTANMPGLSYPLLTDGIDYPGVQVMAPLFNQNTGFDVGNYDVNPFDNFSYDEYGRPTYDPAILDARYRSSYLDTFLGTRPTDINVDGGAYISPFTSHAPEELVPGAEFDTLDMRVYTTPGSDWLQRGHGFPGAHRRYVYDGSPLSFEGIIPNPMVVVMFNVTLGIETEPMIYDWANYQLIDPLYTSPGDTVDVYVTGVGGGNQLMYDTYLGSTLTNGNEIIIPFPTSTAPNPPIDSIYEFLIYNGETRLYQNIDYTYAPHGVNKTKITFTHSYGDTDRINLVAFGYGYNGTTYNWSLPEFDTPFIVVTDPNQYTYTFTNDMQGTNPINTLVVYNGTRLTPYEGIRHVGNGYQTTYALPDRGGYAPSLVANNDVEVYVDSQPQIQNVNFIVDPWDGISLTRTITFISGAPAAGSVINIGVRTIAQYWITGNEITIRADQGITLNEGDVIEVVSWGDTREQDFLTQVFVGPPGVYDTGRPIITPERVLVNLDGYWLFYGDGFTVEGSNVVILQPAVTSTSVVAITSFTQNVVPEAMAFRIFQDMRGVQLTYRITPDTTTTLIADVSATDDIIYVDNVLTLPEPNFDNNIWGTITIGAERIMYRNRDTITNTVSGLLRGTAGTAITSHVTGDLVYSLGNNNLLPQEYQDYIVSNSTLGNGQYVNGVLTGTTVFTAADISLALSGATIWVSTNSYSMGDAVVNGGNYYRAIIDVPANTSINSTEYWEPTSHALQVYLGGILQTSGYTVTSENPVEITFTSPPLMGVEVTMLVRRGVTWYAPGVGTPSNGNPLQITETIAARFLRG